MTQEHSASDAPGEPREPHNGQGSHSPAHPPSDTGTPWVAPGQREPSAPTWVPPGNADAPPPPGPATPGQPAAWGAPPAGHATGPRPGLIALRPVNMSEILNGAFSYIRHNAKAVLGLSLLVVAVFSLPVSIGMGGYFGDYGSWLGQILADPSAADVDTLPIAPWAIITMYGGLVFNYIGQIVLTGLLAAVVGLAVLGRKLSMNEAVQAVRGRMAAVFGVAGLLFLITLGFTILLVVVLAGAIGVGYLFGPTIGVIVGLVGLAASVAVALWIWVRTSLAMPVTVLERIGPASALARSWRLTQRSWWRVFWILLLATIVASIVANLVTTPFSLVGMFVPILSPGAFWTYVVATASSFVAIVLSGTLTAPFVIGVTTLLYVDLRMRREGLDLRMQAAAHSGEALEAEVYLPDTRMTSSPPDARFGRQTYGNPV